MQYNARMPAHVIVWDLETVPDLRGFWIAADFKTGQFPAAVTVLIRTFKLGT
jgi:hypothetical protein